jgi:lysophospholipase L1-like esterase
VKKKLLHLAVAILLVLCAIELISFIFFSVFRDRFGLRNPHKYTVARADIPKLKQVYDFSLGWKKRFSTPFGERPRRTEYGRPLMAAFGDSFTYCDQVRDAETWEEQLAEMLSADIYNFGVSGYGTDQAYIRFREEVPKVGAPIVSRCLITENINRIVNRYRPFYYNRTEVTLTKPRFILRGGARELIENPVRNENEIDKLRDPKFVESVGENDWWFRRDDTPALSFPYTAILFNQRFWLEILHRRGGGQIDDVTPRPRTNLWADPPARNLMFSILDSFMEESKAAGKAPFIGVLPYPGEVFSEMQGRRPKPIALLCSYCRSRGYPCFNGAMALAKHAHSAAEVDEFFNFHFTPLGNKIIAEELHAFLIDQKLIDLPVNK